MYHSPHNISLNESSYLNQQQYGVSNHQKQQQHVSNQQQKSHFSDPSSSHQETLSILSTSQQRSFITWSNEILSKYHSCNPTHQSEAKKHPASNSRPKRTRKFQIESYEQLADPNVLNRVIGAIFMCGKEQEWLEREALASSCNVTKSQFHSFNNSAISATSLSFSGENASILKTPAVPGKRATDRKTSTSNDQGASTMEYSPMSVGELYASSRGFKRSHNSITVESLLNGEMKCSDLEAWRILMQLIRLYYTKNNTKCSRVKQVLQALNQCDQFFRSQEEEAPASPQQNSLSMTAPMTPFDTLPNNSSILGTSSSQNKNLSASSSIEDSFLMEHSPITNHRDTSSVISISQSEAIALSTIIHLIIGVVILMEERGTEMVECILQLDTVCMRNIHELVRNGIATFGIGMPQSDLQDQENIEPNHSTANRQSSSSSRSPPMSRSKSTSTLASKLVDAALYGGNLKDSLQNNEVTPHATPSKQSSSMMVRSASSPSALDTMKAASFNRKRPRQNKLSTQSKKKRAQQQTPNQSTTKRIKKSKKNTASQKQKRRSLTKSFSTSSDVLLQTHSHNAHRKNFLMQQKSEASLQHLSLVQENKQLKSFNQQLQDRFMDLLSEHDSLKESYDAMVENNERRVEDRFNHHSNSQSILETVKAESRVFSSPSYEDALGTSQHSLNASGFEKHSASCNHLSLLTSPEKSATATYGRRAHGMDHLVVSPRRHDQSVPSSASPLKSRSRVMDSSSFLDDTSTGSPFEDDIYQKHQYPDFEQMEHIRDLEEELERVKQKLARSVESSTHQSTEISVLRSQITEFERKTEELNHFRERCHHLMQFKTESKKLQEQVASLESKNCEQSAQIQQLKKQHSRENQILRSQVHDLKSRNQNLHSVNSKLQDQVEQLTQQLKQQGYQREIDSIPEPQLVLLDNNPLRSQQLRNQLQHSSVKMVDQSQQVEMELLDMSSPSDKTMEPKLSLYSGDVSYDDDVDPSDIEALNALKQKQIAEVEALLLEAAEL